MLSSTNVRKINDQINDELQIVDLTFTPHKQKMEALERIAALKAILDTPVPVKPEPTTDSLIEDVARVLRDRRR